MGKDESRSESAGSPCRGLDLIVPGLEYAVYIAVATAQTRQIAASSDAEFDAFAGVEAALKQLQSAARFLDPIEKEGLP